MAIDPKTIQELIDKPRIAGAQDNTGGQQDIGRRNNQSKSTIRQGGNSRADNAPNSNPPKPNPASVRFNGIRTDLRVKIEVPSSYLRSYTRGWDSNLQKLHGIVFPYTPQISVEHKADYTSQTPLHSNYAINFYKSSMVSDISVSGVFTVQNKADAVTYLATVHLLRALTKGRFGGSDPLRGNPPPVCRLHAYGGFMLDSVPVAVTSFKQDLPSDVDYFYINDSVMGEASVPTKSTISIGLKPMFSRQEMLDATVPDWLTNSTQRINGLL
jgi:hypothetical protein